MDIINQYKEIFENLYEGVYFVDTERTITFWNKGAELISGFASSEVVNKHCYDNILVHTDDVGTKLCIQGCPLHSTMQTKEKGAASVYMHHKTGYRIPVLVKTFPLVENGIATGAVEVFQIKQENFDSIVNIEELKQLALTDQLTGLPNRRYTETYLTSKINEYRSLGIKFGILFLDIDHFKQFNDQYGHSVGDDILRLLAKTYNRNIRSKDFIGRWGGEEFLAVCTCSDDKSLMQIAEKVRVLSEKTMIATHKELLNVTISIGATLFRTDDSADTLIKRADALLYKCKAHGRNRVFLE